MTERFSCKRTGYNVDLGMEIIIKEKQWSLDDQAAFLNHV